MKTFRDFLKEDVMPTAQVADGSLDIEKPAVRAAINAAIAGVTSQPAVTPYVVYNRLSKLLAQYHIILPRKFLEGDKGVEVFELKQFGHRMGMTDGGEFVNETPSTHYLFLQYGILSPFGITYAKPVVGGMFKVAARLVDKEELDKLLDMAEVTMSEEAEVRQNAAKARAPKEEMHDITSDEKKKGNKEAVADSKKGLDEELSHGARELTLHADNDQQLHRSSHQPIIKNLQRKHDKGTYDHDKATKLWKYHADRAAKSYEKQHGGKFSVADRKAAAAHFADSARSEHGFGSVKEEKNDLKDACWKGYTAKGLKKKGGKMVPNCVPVSEEQIDEVSKGAAIRAYGAAKDASDSDSRAEKIAGRLKKHIARKFGGETVKHAERHAYASHFGRPNTDYGTDRLERAKPSSEMRKTKSGKVHKQDVESKKSEIKFRKTMSKFDKKGHLPEENLAEKAPPGAKFERMVKHIKKGYSDDGLTKKEKSIAYATAWKAKKKETSEE